MKATLHDLSFTMDGAQVISFRTTEDCRALYEQLKGRELTVTAKKFHKARSLNANAYAWVLLDQLAEKMHTAKESLYRGYVRNIGGNNDNLLMSDEAAGRFCIAWQSYGLGWVTDVKPSGAKGMSLVTAYYGSSTYDTAQMARLIDLIVQDCRNVGIETRDPNDIESMLEAWDGR